jgi:hypothetical protein
LHRRGTLADFPNQRWTFADFNFGAGNWREFCEFDGTFRIELAASCRYDCPMQNARALPQPAFDPSRGYLKSLQERPVAPAVDARALRLTLNREALGSIHTAHDPHVLKVCRRFFRHSEDAEDAAAEVFLKLHAVLEKKNQKYPFRSWGCQLAGRHSLTNCAGASAKNAASSPGMIFAPSRTFSLLLLSHKFCTTKQNAK